MLDPRPCLLVEEAVVVVMEVDDGDGEDNSPS